MNFFKRAPWRVDDVPRVRLAGADSVIDIGFLEGDEHRRAFAALFRRAFEDNAATIGGAELVEIHGKLGGAFEGVALPLVLDATDLEDLALRLYDSRNEVIELVLRRATDRLVLNVTFDDPSFWLSPFPV